METYESKLKSSDIDMLFEMILMLETEEDCYRFFEDVCTVAELRAIAQRLEVAAMLRQGVTYQEIAKRLGASTATISRVNRSLSYGTGGYTRMFERLEERERESAEPDR